MSVLLRFWWAVLLLVSFPFTLRAIEPDHKDGILMDSVEDKGLHSFYLAVEKAQPELQELRSSFDNLREKYNHFHTLDDMLANFGQPQDEDFKEDMEEEEVQAWEESTKAWIRDIEANMAKDGITLNISELKRVVNNATNVALTNVNKSKEQDKLVNHEETKLETDLSTKNDPNVEDKPKDDCKALARATNSNLKEDMVAVPIPEHSKRPKRSLEEEQEEPLEERTVAKRRAELLDDFEDHNGNRASFGVLGNGMLTPDAEELGGQSRFFPGHEILAHDNDLEASHDYESEAQVYDPTINVVPLINQQQQQEPAEQQPQKRQPKSQPKARSSQFKASFNLKNLFGDMQKQQPQQPPANPVPVPQLQYQHPMPIKQPNTGVYWYRGPFFNRNQKLNFDPNCVPITVYPPNCNPPGPGDVLTGAPTGAPNGALTGVPNGAPTGVPNGAPNGALTVTPNGSPTGAPNGAPNGAPTAAPIITTPMPTAATTTDVGDACNQPDAVKMNVAINANVCGDPKTKMFSGNGSISVQPVPKKFVSQAIEESQDAVVDERHIRDVTENFTWELKKEDKKTRDAPAKAASTKEKRKKKLHAKKSSGKAAPKLTENDQKKDRKNSTKCNNTGKGQKNQTTKCTPRPEPPEPRPSSFDKMISGKLPEEIVDAVFEAIGCDPEMERLVPVLQRNRQRQKQPKNFYQIRNNKTEGFVRQTETMVRDTMQAISEIIEQQVGRRACIPLRPDLVDFYELILKTAEEEEKVREKRQSSLEVLSADFSEDVRLLDPAKINEKTRIVKKLLQQYQDLPLNDQLAAVKTHDELLLDLEYLHKMADTVERRRRDACMEEAVKQQTLDKGLEEHVNSEYSPRFIKLLKTAELFKESGETLAKDRI